MSRKQIKHTLHERKQRGFDLEDIVLRPITMWDVLKHKRMCESSKKVLGNYLGWAENIGRWEMKQHLRWISIHTKSTGYYEAYGAFLNEQMMGFITFSPAKDFVGIQICYYTNALYASMGIGSLLTDVMVQRAFIFNKFQYVELHIDVENIASQRVAEKNGFQAVVDYECAKSGKLGSGKMQVWVKINPDFADSISLNDFRNGNNEYLIPAYHSLNAAVAAISALRGLAEILSGFKP